MSDVVEPEIRRVGSGTKVSQSLSSIPTLSHCKDGHIGSIWRFANQATALYAFQSKVTMLYNLFVIIFFFSGDHPDDDHLLKSPHEGGVAHSNLFLYHVSYLIVERFYLRLTDFLCV